MKGNSNIVCIAEDRSSAIGGVMLLIKSLHLHSPEAFALHLTSPVATGKFGEWLRKYPRVSVSTSPLEGAYGWNVKPHALLQLLGRGFARVMWIDSDIITTGDITPL